jgi:cytidylate kinase
MRDERKLLDAILGDFDLNEPVTEGLVKTGAPVTIWLPAAAKMRYDKLQKRSGRRLSKKAREVLIALLDAVEARAS